MIYFCADDYGVSKTCNDRIEKCLKHGALNKVSVLPNGEITDFKNRLSSNCERVSLHINLVEGTPLSDVNDIPLLVSEQGYFKYSFVGLFFLSMSRKRKELEKQLYKEIRAQILFWIEMMGERVPISIDGHQHTHMIPLIFKTIMKVIKDQKIPVEYVRIPNEPIMPYVFTPSLYFTYSLTGLIKQWLLKFLTLLNQNELKNAQIDFSYFTGALRHLPLPVGSPTSQSVAQHHHLPLLLRQHRIHRSAQLLQVLPVTDSFHEILIVADYVHQRQCRPIGPGVDIIR